MMKLSYKFLMVVVLSFLGSVLLFYILFANRYRAMDFYIANYTDLKSPAEQIDDMQKKITETRISRKDKKAILELMKQYPSLSMQLYSNDREYIADHILSDEGISINTRSVWVELYYPEEKDFQLKFYDGDCYLIVQSYQGMTFIMIYLFVSSTIALGLFFSITIHFVRKKMKYVLRLENEMKLIESGDLQHQIECVGNDEIGSLATQLDHLRVALKENMEKESEARKANEELITTMSHDLRTPLTSLMGYLDILEMKKIGFNMVRKHIKIEPQRWYYHCDRLGVIVWQDMVNGGEKYQSWFVTYLATVLSGLGITVKDHYSRLFARRSQEGRSEFINEVKETIQLLKKHPSICTWVIFNEGWGQFATQRITDMVRKIDSEHLIDSASGWFDQGTGDFQSIHNYFFPLKVKPEDVRATVLSEYGGFTLEVEEHTASEKKYGYGGYKTKAEYQKAYRQLEYK